jgi:predicted dehydrogenase
MKEKIRLGILGCGAITAGYHLPAAVAHPRVQVVALVDSNSQRAQNLRQAHHLECRVVSDYKEILGELDAVIIALPNHLHTPVALETLNAGLHVLCEKPLSITVAGARSCCEAASRRGVLLAVGLHWRFQEGSLLLPLVMDGGLVSPVLRYDWEHGAPWDWDTASGFYFSRAQAGGGVLIDSGVHVLDSLVHWFGPVVRLDYQDDNWGSGIEANCILTLRHNGRYGEVSGRVRLSRMYTLKNRLLVHGEHCRAEIPAYDAGVVILFRQIAGREVSMTLRLTHRDRTTANNPFDGQLDNFVESIRGTQQLVSNGSQALEVIEFIDRCYAQAGRIPEPWSEVLRPVGGKV